MNKPEITPPSNSNHFPDGTRSYTDEFKREAVALLASSGRPLMQIAEELGIQPSMLRRWRNAVGVPAGASRRPDTQAMPPQAGSPGDQSAEIACLRREVERLRMERDILKKTVAIFSEPPK